jgi:uncharacterized caspase-like protein
MKRSGRVAACPDMVNAQGGRACDKIHTGPVKKVYSPLCRHPLEGKRAIARPLSENPVRETSMMKPATAVILRAATIFGRVMIVAAFMTAAALALSVEASASKRVALVIGNSAYQHAGVLANPSNDATDMGAALNELGFKVVVGNDLDNRGMREKIREFAAELRGADVAMFFYAGHAVQVNGRNYLAPIDTKLEFESDVDFETIPIEFIQRQMEREVETILVFLDACRDNPISRSLKAASRSNGTGKGLAEEKLSAAGTFIAFSTDPGNVALDGKGRNSPFAKALVENIKRPGVEISTMMTDVRVQVRAETNGAQTPWTNSSLLGHFYFNPAAPAQQPAGENVAALDSNAATQNGTQPANGAKVDDARVAALAWESVKDSTSVEALEYFLASFGDTFYGGLARLRIEQLKGGKTASSTDNAKDTAIAGTTTSTEAKPAEEAATTEGETKLAEETKVASLATEEPARSVEPEFDRREVARGIQQELQRLGCSAGKVDGLWGDKSVRALDSLSRSAGIKLVSADPKPELLDQLRDHKGKGCAVICSAKETVKNGRCVAKVCPAGQQLSSKGSCFTPKTKQAKAEPEPRKKRQTQQVQRQQVIVQQQPQQVIVQEQPQQVIVDEGPVLSGGGRSGGGLSIGIGGGGIVCIVGGC